MLDLKKICLIVCVLCSACSDTPDKSIRLTEENIISADVSSDGKLAIIAEVVRKEEDKIKGKGKAKLWDLVEEKILYEWSHEENKGTDINKVALSKNGLLAVTIEKKNIGIWDTLTGKNKGFWNMPKPITDVAISKSGKLGIFSFAEENVAVLINLNNGQQMRVFQFDSEIVGLDIADNGSLVVFASKSNKVELWKTFDKEKLKGWQFPYHVKHVKFSNDRKRLLISPIYQEIVLYNIDEDKEEHKLAVHKGALSFFAKPLINVSSSIFNNENSLIITGAPPRNLYSWDVQSGDLLSSWQLPKQPSIWYPTSAIIYGTGFLEDKAISISSDGYAYFWNLN